MTLKREKFILFLSLNFQVQGERGNLMTTRSGETRHPLVHIMYMDAEGHLVSPPDRRLMMIHGILCPQCDADPFGFVLAGVEDLPRTKEEYDRRVMCREEIELYGRKES